MQKQASTPIPKPAIEELVTLAARGDLHACNTLVVQHERIVFGLAFQKIRNHASAQDIAQESFLRAFRNIGKLRNHATFTSWLCGITSNVVREYIRHTPQREVPLESVHEPIAPAADTGDPAQLDRLYERVAGLPAKYRIPLTMRYTGKMTYRDIATTLRITEVTARSYVYRARAMLAAKMTRSAGI